MFVLHNNIKVAHTLEHDIFLWYSLFQKFNGSLLNFFIYNFYAVGFAGINQFCPCVSHLFFQDHKSMFAQSDGN
jgi:hypothetical protein